REWVDHCSEILQPELGCDLRPYLFDTTNQKGNGRVANLRAMLNGERVADALSQTTLAQPAVFVIEYALAQLLQSWGIEPAAMVGHSLGEYVAACVAGVMSLEAALRLVARRAALIAQTEAGALLTISLPAAEVEARLPEGLALSGVLTPDVCVVGGRDTAVRQWAAQLQDEGISCRVLPTDHAYHTPLLASIQAEFGQLMSQIDLQPPQIPYLSNVTGDWITAEQATDPAYWTAHLCQPVQMAAALGALLAQPETALLEVGAGQALAALLKQHPACERERMNLILPLLPGMYEQQPERAFVWAALGKLWLAGVDVDWTAVWQHQARCRLSLPTYPFEPLRFWVEALDVQTVIRPSGTSDMPTSIKKAEVADWFYRPVWREHPIEMATAVLPGIASDWLIFNDGHGLGQQMAAQIRQQGGRVVEVIPGPQFSQSQTDTWQFTICPGHKADYLALCRELATAGRLPQKVVHLWSVGDIESGAAHFTAVQETGFYSLIYLVQAFSEQNVNDPLDILLLSSNAQAVTGAETLYPEKTTIFGVCRAIAQECITMRCRAIDVDMAEALPVLTPALLADFLSPETALEVAYRQGQRFERRYEPARLEAQRPLPLRSQGTYLITGGLGGIGLVLAKHLAQTQQARLVLVGRSGLPERTAWDDWLTSRPESDVTSARIRQVQALERLGAEVLVAQADVADAGQMQQVVETAVQQFGTIHGVIHAAGISDPGSFNGIQVIEPWQCEQHFRPKVHGLYALESALAGHDLDFCLLYSSLSSILGGLGFVGYTAANIFMDALTHQHNRAASGKWISVNWDTWQLNAHQHEIVGRTVAAYEMTPAEGIAALECILASGVETQIINSTGDLETRIRQWLTLEGLTTQTSSQRAGYERPDLGTAYVAAGKGMEKQIAQVWEA
ncbi:MAG: SDR family NAD(P)-dependent oxidoreductase, partial [Anaerolineae bacterium]|nr:SDR family NAD(P)-dependent oxidoreductase [Anaerolineae bacterium]